jgi:voltage-gated potassium channel
VSAISARSRVHGLLELQPENTKAAKILQCWIMTLILVNVASVVVDSVEWIHTLYRQVFYLIEVFSVAVFSCEYLLRVWSCVEDPRYRQPVLGRLRFMVSPMAVIDLLAILPSYFPLAFHNTNLLFLRVLRFFRLIRILKVGRYSESLQMLTRIVRSKREELLLTAIVVVILVVFSSSLLFLAEHSAQPDQFSDIPKAMWWSVVTLTTVGYGDIYPITVAGKMIASVISILGVALFGLPTAILAAGFVEEMQNRRSQRVCPHCGEKLEKQG